ncbi:MAG: hypothetical protein QNL03_09750 [Gammaproteobacteria bacterium]|nr:hypothetical protein [Gammaproteobacteria bacterium]
MSNIDGVKEFYGLVKKPKLSAKEEQVAEAMLAKIREHQKRYRKEQLYFKSPDKLLGL